MSADLAGAGAPVVMLLALAALLVWPLVDVFVVGLLTSPPPLALVRDTLAVALGATVGALGLAAVVAAAVRVGMPGRSRVVAICRAGVLVPPFVAPLALLVVGGRDGLLIGAGAGLHGPAAIAIAQAFAFLPHAFVLVMRALAGVSIEAEQAAELLGASPWTVLRRVTLGLARPGLVTAALVVLGLCLADVAAPLLVGGRAVVLGGFIVAAADWTATAAAGAVALAALTLAVAAAGRTWRYVTAPLALGSVRPTGQRPAAAVRVLLSTLAWLVVVTLVSLWSVVPLAALVAARGGSLTHGAGLLRDGAPLVNTLLLGIGVAFMGTGLALAVASIAERRRGAVAGAVTALARGPVAIPGVVGGVGYLLAFGAPKGDLVLVALLVAVWELPLMLRVAGNVLARSDRSTEQAALTFGAGPVTMLRRVVLPGLRPAVVWLLCHGFAAGVAAVGTVVIIAERVGLELGVLHMLHSASTGSVGAACAVATLLLALAGGATLLGRAVAGRESIPTLLA